MIIALSLNGKYLEELKSKSSEIDKRAEEKWPGCGWIIELRKMSEIDVLSSDETLKKINEGKLDPKEVLVLQEEGLLENALLKAGCTPWINFCLESPLYASQFYAHIDEFREKFMHSMYFDWRENKKTQPVYFPSFSEHDLMPPEPWEGRKFINCIMSNKWERDGGPNSLHPARLNLLNSLLGRPGFELYGRGWGNAWMDLEIGFKAAIQRSYKYSICYENYVKPGYITEKVIHSLVAGSIPVYLGAPDVWDYVPENLFIDARGLTPQEIWDKCQNLPDDKAKEMIQAGQRWLKTEGLDFSYSRFAKRVLNLVP